MKNKINRACVFAHYDRDNVVDEYVYYYVKELKKVVSIIVFVTVSKISEDDKKRLNNLNIQLIERENIGYDFYSYKTGIESLDLKNYDELLICNDSVFGPIYSIEKLFNSMAKVKCDFWGITEGYDKFHHLQSYFVVYKKNIIHSKIFLDFWKNIKIIDNKNKLIEMYEIGLSKKLIENNFSLAVYAKSRVSLREYFRIYLKLSRIRRDRLIRILLFILPRVLIWNVKKEYNSSILFWEFLFKVKKVPFIKKSLFITDKYKKEDLQILYEIDWDRKGYPVEIIFKYIDRMNK